MAVARLKKYLKETSVVQDIFILIVVHHVGLASMSIYSSLRYVSIVHTEA